MATWPAKTDYATGDVLSATNMNDIGNGLNDLYGESFTNNFYAGKNKIINGNFGVWQRGTSTTTNDTYLADRWRHYWDGSGTFTVSQQTFTPASAPVAGYEGTYFERLAMNTAGSTTLYQLFTRIEDVRTFAGQTFTLSFWAKANTNTTLNYYVEQYFGSGGSATVTATSGTQSLTSAWQRFSITYTMPSISGKTIGTGSYVQLTFRSTSLGAGAYLDFWGMQMEAGSTATPFQTASGSIGGELALCQRYYYRWTAGDTYRFCASGAAYSTTQASIQIPYPTQMRVGATALDTSGMTCHLVRTDNYLSTGSFSLANQQGNNASVIYTHGSGVFTAGDFVNLSNAGTSTGYIGFTAEL